MSNVASDIPEALRRNNLPGALTELKSAIRRNPADQDLRFLLFDLLALDGDYEGASRQAVVAAGLQSGPDPMPLLLNSLAAGEVLRRLVFEGRVEPLILGEPYEWMAQAAAGIKSAAGGDWERAHTLALDAREQANACQGELNGSPFDWLMDGDSRLGPVLEVILDGKYYWIPQDRVKSLVTDPPSCLTHSLWLPASIALVSGADIYGFLPARYPVTPETDIACRLGKTTSWFEPIPGFHLGSGQKVLMTETQDFALLDMRRLSFTTDFV
jgi:type VI secretion system protein ImpE